jgi:uncharacterized membrane protein YfcA
VIHALQFLSIGVIGGFLSGLLGIGGGVVFIPLLVYLGHTPIKVATSVSMVVIIFASASGLLAHHRAKNIHFPTGLWMGIASIFSALVGSFVSGVISDMVLYHLYTGLVATALIMLLLSAKRGGPPSAEFCLRKLPTLLVGILQGLLTGLLGIGGGFIVVPFLVYLLDMPTLLAIGTSLLIILFSAIAGLFGKIMTIQFNPTITIWVVAGSIPAAQIGAWVAQKTGQRLLRLFLIILLGLILARVIGDLVF